MLNGIFVFLIFSSILLADPQRVRAGRRASGRLSFEAWLDESRDLAREVAYTPAVIDAVRASEKRSPRRRFS